MTRSPIDIMLGRTVFTCLKCGAKEGTCSCWERDDITLSCPTCGKQGSAPREDHDLPGTARVVTPCPDCDKGDQPEVLYFDKDGLQIFEGGSDA